MGPRAGLDTEDRGKILCPCRGSTRPKTRNEIHKYFVAAKVLQQESPILFRIYAFLQALSVVAD
jgi:hypothetical protein